MRHLSFMLPLLLLPAVVHAQNLRDFHWVPLPPTKSVMVNGVPYDPESAGKSWSILRADNAKSNVYRFEVRSGDMWSEDARQGAIVERSELDGWRANWNENTDIWCAYSLFIERGRPYNSAWTGIGQLHGQRALYAPLYVGLKNDMLSVGTWLPAPGGSWAPSTLFVVEITREIWHNVVFHFRANLTGSGVIEFWIDSKKMADFKGAVGGVPSDAVYWKFGIYRGYGPIAVPLAVRFSNVEVGTKVLADRVVSPLPID